MSDQTERVVPSSRLPVTPDDPASATAAPAAVDPDTSPAAAADIARGGGSGVETDDRISGTNALNPTSSSAASAGLPDEVRPATFADAEAESVRTGGTPDFGGGSTGPAGGAGSGSFASSSDTYPAGTYTSGASADDTYPRAASSSLTPEDTYPGTAGRADSPTYPGSGYSSAVRADDSRSDESARGQSDLMATGQPGADRTDATSAYAGATALGATVASRSAAGGASASERAKAAAVKAKGSAAQLVTQGRASATRYAQENDRVGAARAKVQAAAADNPLVQKVTAKAAQVKASRQQPAGKRRASAAVEEQRPAPPPLPGPPTGPRSQEQIERDIEARRTHLAWAVDEINHRVKPANLAAKGKAQAQAQVVDPASGSVRRERVGPAVGAVVGLILLRVLRARRRRKQARRRAARLARY